jgi:starch phosphorylase
MHGDSYMHLADLKSYLETDERLTRPGADQMHGARMAILNVARSGHSRMPPYQIQRLQHFMR